MLEDVRRNVSTEPGHCARAGPGPAKLRRDWLAVVFDHVLRGKPSPALQVRHEPRRNRRRRAALVGLDCILGPAIEDACIKIKPSASRVRHPLQPQHRIVSGTGIEADQNEPDKMSVDTEAIAGAIAIKAKRGPKESSNFIALQIALPTFTHLR